METKNLFDAFAITIALLSLGVTLWMYFKAKKEENIKHLLGEKETVGFAALKIFNKGLPDKENERKELISAIMQACLFERSDRARALLFRVIELNREKYSTEFSDALDLLEETNKSMQSYGFTKEQLDTATAELRISAIRKVVNKTR